MGYVAIILIHMLILLGEKLKNLKEEMRFYPPNTPIKCGGAPQKLCT